MDCLPRMQSAKTPKPLTLSDGLVGAIAKYMSNRPYGEVSNIMSALLAELQPQYVAREEAAKPKKPAPKPTA